MSIAYARHVGRAKAVQAAAKAEEEAELRAVPALTADGARALAKAEGLTLMRSASAKTGYRGVIFDKRVVAGNGYEVSVTPPGEGGRQHYLGRYATAEEAALVHARYWATICDAFAPIQPH